MRTTASSGLSIRLDATTLRASGPWQSDSRISKHSAAFSIRKKSRRTHRFPRRRSSPRTRSPSCPSGRARCTPGSTRCWSSTTTTRPCRCSCATTAPVGSCASGRCSMISYPRVLLSASKASCLPMPRITTVRRAVFLDSTRGSNGTLCSSVLEATLQLRMQLPRRCRCKPRTCGQRPALLLARRAQSPRPSRRPM